MTEFGARYLAAWLRGRILLIAPALLLVLLNAWVAPTPVLYALIVVLVLNIVASFCQPFLLKRLGISALYFAFVLDIIGIAIAIQYTGGIVGGFAAAYVVIALNSILLLGRTSIVRVIGLILLALGVEIVLEIFGFSKRNLQLPFWALLIAQIILLASLLYSSYMLASTGANLLALWQDAKHIAETGRSNAEYEQQRWILIHKVALRVQESISAHQVYDSIGQELERVDLHCAILEWAQVGVSLRAAYYSLSAELFAQYRRQFQTESHRLDFALAHHPSLARVMETRAPVLIRDPLTEARLLLPTLDAETLTQALARLKIQRTALVPMIVREEVIGILSIFGETITTNDLAPFAALAQQAASALDKARLLSEQQKRAAQLELVNNIAARVSSAENAEQVIQPLVRQVGEQFGYEIVSVVLVDPDRQQVYVAALHNCIRAFDLMNWRHPITTGILGFVARTGEMYLARDTRTDPNYLSPNTAEDPVRSELALPLRAGERVIGVLDVESVQPNAFDTTDIDALTLLADQVSAALNKTRQLALEQKRAAHLALVSEIAARAAAFSEPDVIVRTMVDLVQQRFGYHHVCVTLYNPARRELEQRAAAGPNAHLYPLGKRWDASKGLIGLAARTMQTVYSGDITHDPRYLPDPDTVANSALCVPLIAGKNVLGVLDIESDVLFAFDANDIGAMETLANQMSAALEKARLLQAERRRAVQLSLVNRVASRTARLMPTEQLVREAVELVQTQFGYYNVAVFMRDEETMAVRLVAAVGGLVPLVAPRTVITGGIVGYVVASAETYLCHDPLTDARYVSPFPTRTEDPVKSELAIPLRRGDQVIGVLDIQSQETNVFSPGDISALEALADQLAAALENARLLDALQTRLHVQQTLSDTSAALLETTDPAMIVNQAATAAQRALHCEIVIVFLPNDKGALEPRAYLGVAPEKMRTLQLPCDPDYLPGRTFTTRAPALWSQTHPSPWTRVHPAIHESQAHAGMAVPMLVGENAVGVILMQTLQERQFDTIDAQTLALLADQTASALERARYFKQLQRHVDELNLLFDGYRATSSTLDPDQVIARLLERLVRALDLTSAYFVQADLAQNQFTHTHEYLSEHASAGERHATSRVWSISAMPELQSVVQRRTDILYANDPNLSDAVREYMARYGAQTILRVPLIASDQLIGYLSLWESRAPRAWSQDETRFVETMASQAAAALINAQLYQAAHTRTRELQALHEASRVLNASLDMRTILENSVDALRDMLRYHHVSIYFVERDRLRLQVQRGYDNEFDDIPLGQGIMARAVNSQTIIFLQDVANDPEFLAAIPNAQSEIAVPLIVGERVLGVLNVETMRAEPGALTKERLTLADAQLLSTFANQLVVAIENARLFQETQARLEQVRTLHAASQALNADLELDVVLARVAEQFINTLDLDFCTLLELDQFHGEFVVLFDLDRDPQLHVNSGDRIPVNSIGRIDNVLELAAPIEYHIDDPDLDQIVRADMTHYACRSELIVPLVSKGRVFGVIELGDRKQKRQFRADEVQLAESLANQAAVSIVNARLYRDAQRQLQETETLYHFARELGGTLDIRQLGKRALDAAARLTNFDIGEVSLVRDDGALVPLIMIGIASDSGNRESLNGDHVVPPGVGIVAWVAEHGRTVRLNDVTRDPRYVAMSPETKSEICVPLRVGPRVIGVLNLETKAPNAFDVHAEELLTVFANQLAIAIENARLYEQTKRDAEVKAALLRELSHRVKNNLAAITSLLYMALDEPPEAREQILSETLGRVQSMALAHGLLARSGLASVNLADLGRQVLNDAVRNLAPPGAPIQVIVSGDAVRVGAHQTTTLALVLNELVTNSVRHGFANGTAYGKSMEAPADPILHFHVIAHSNDVECFLEDNGRGLPENFVIDGDAGLGLNLVRTLVEKDLHGHFQLERRAPWTRAEIRFRLTQT